MNKQIHDQRKNNNTPPTFDATQIGIPANNGDNYGLLYRPANSGAFSEVATATMSLGQVSFSHLPADGVYAVGKLKPEVALSMIKSVDNTTPNIGDEITFTLTIKNSGPSSATDVSVQDIVPTGFSTPTHVSSPAGTTFTIVGNTIEWSGIAVPVDESVFATFKTEVLTP